MRVLGAVAMIALLAGPAYAQQTPIPRYGDLTSKTPKQIEEERAAEKAYKKSLGNIPDQTTPSDPWGNARSASEPKAAAKTPPAKPQAKAGSATK